VSGDAMQRHINLQPRHFFAARHEPVFGSSNTS